MAPDSHLVQVEAALLKSAVLGVYQHSAGSKMRQSTVLPIKRKAEGTAVCSCGFNLMYVLVWVEKHFMGWCSLPIKQ